MGTQPSTSICAFNNIYDKWIDLNLLQLLFSTRISKQKPFTLLCGNTVGRPREEKNATNNTSKTLVSKLSRTVILVGNDLV